MTALRFGRYETLRQIASGGMATVYLGRVIGAGGFQRVVAIKVMHPHIASDPEFVAMFLDEARLAAGIHHPNVVATLDIEQAPEGLFIVMDYIDGPPLLQLLKEARQRDARIPLPIALRIFLDVLAGLNAAHELKGPDRQLLKLVHRDVSPQNVLVGRDGSARITDFGVARAEARISSTRGGELKGKLPYMPPEQVRAEPLDRRCDVYAAGCVLWEMLVGKRLFRADNDAALVAQIVGGVRYSPSDVDPSVPVAIGDATMRALTDVKDRYPSTAAFAMALEDAAARSGVIIASQRAVAEYVDRACPSIDGPLPDAPSSSISSISSSSLIALGSGSSHITGATSANMSASNITAQPARRGVVAALAVSIAIAASAVTGAVVFVATRSTTPPLPAVNAAPPPDDAQAHETTAVTLPAPERSPDPAPAATTSASASATEPKATAKASAPSPTKPSKSPAAARPSARKTGTFRPEDP